MAQWLGVLAGDRQAIFGRRRQAKPRGRPSVLSPESLNRFAKQEACQAYWFVSPAN